MPWQKFAVIFILLLFVFGISPIFATPNFSLAPIPKYAKKVEDLPPGLYVVIYPHGNEGPITVPRTKVTVEGRKNFYTFILTLMKVDFGDDGFEPFLAEVEVQNVGWEKDREGMNVRQQLLEISDGPTGKIMYFHPRANELYEDYCIYRLINTNGQEKCS